MAGPSCTTPRAYAGSDDSGHLRPELGDFTHYAWVSTVYDTGGPLQTQWDIDEIELAGTWLGRR